MKILLNLNKIILFACTSMYFGTGWSLVLFSFPIAQELTADNYYMQFVPQVHAATGFFTYMTMLMMVNCVIFIIGEWKTSKIWYPIVLKEVLNKWMNLNTIRVSIWTLQWLTMATYFFQITLKLKSTNE
jgi:hypothetical protein